MIVSASRRTDIPAFYTEWFFSRLREGFVLVRNPMNRHQVSRVSLHPSVVDCIVFWTKNPESMIRKLDLLDRYTIPYYFLFTITPYGKNIEKGLPPKDQIIESFILLSERIGKERVIWRYDPVLLTKEIDLRFHSRSFRYIAERLKGYTQRCIISFLTLYRKCRRNLAGIDVVELLEEEKFSIARIIGSIAQDYGVRIETCATDIDLSGINIEHGKCIDDELISSITGKPMRIRKDRSQRDSCRCVESTDIGAYNSCLHHCLYCYANENRALARANNAMHDPSSPLLLGKSDPAATIVEKTPDISCLPLFQKTGN